MYEYVCGDFFGGAHGGARCKSMYVGILLLLHMVRMVVQSMPHRHNFVFITVRGNFSIEYTQFSRLKNIYIEYTVIFYHKLYRVTFF